MSWLKIEKKIIVLKYYLLLFYATMHHFSIGLWHEMKSGFYRWWWPVQWLDREEAPKYFPKPNLHQKKGHGHWLVVCYWSDPLQLSKHWQNHYIWEVCSANQSDAPKTAMPASVIGQQNGPNSSPQHPTASHTTNTSKVKQIGLRSFASSTIFTWPLANRLPFLQASRHFSAGKMLPQPAGGRKCFPRVCQIVKQGFLLYRNKQTYFLLTKMS